MHIRMVLTSVTAVLLMLTLPYAAFGRSVCEHDPYTKVTERDGRTAITTGTPGPGDPTLPLHIVRGGSCSAYSVYLGAVAGVSVVPAIYGGRRVEDVLLTIAVERAWKADRADTQRVRLLWDHDDPPRGGPLYASFALGDTCLVFVSSDSLGEMVAAPTSFVFRDSATLGMFDRSYPMTKDGAIAMVDSCAAERTLAWMCTNADLVVEGDVEALDQRWPSIDPTDHIAWSVRLSDLAVHKGSLAEDVFELVHVHGHKNWPHWPKLEVGQRVLFFLQNDPVATHRLIGGWQGAWLLSGDGSFHIGMSRHRGRLGAVSPDAAVRPSSVQERRFTRSELAEAFSGVGDTLSN